jgi:hypothetical protein
MLAANLATVDDLLRWSDMRSSQADLPRLIRRLILFNSIGLSRATFRSGEGVQLGGWDGVTVHTDAHPFVPLGVTGWELSVRKDVTTKANEDYENRDTGPDGLKQAETTFMFVSSRRWPGKDQWLKDRRAEAKWADIRALDADDLESWLESATAVGVWFSRLIGKHIDGAEDLSSFWNDWANATRTPISPAFLLARRNEALQRIQSEVRSSSRTFVVKADRQKKR